jgi:replicative DNA helicase
VSDLTDCYQWRKTALDAEGDEHLRSAAYALLEHQLQACGIRSLSLLLRTAKRAALHRLKAPEALASVTSSAEQAKDVVDRIDSIASGRDWEHAVSTGLRSLDTPMNGGLPKGEMTLLGAATGAGKTTLAIQIAQTTARRGEGIAYVCSPEMQATDLWLRLAQRECRISRAQIRGGRSDILDRILQAAARQGTDTSLVLLDRADADVGHAIEAAYMLHAQRGPLVLVVLDYAQQLASADASGKELPRYLQVGAVATSALKLAAETGAAVLLTSQINTTRDKDGKVLEQSFRESAVLEQKAAIAVVMAPDREKSEMSITIRKNRHGPLATVALYYDAPCYFLADLEEDAAPWQS